MPRRATRRHPSIVGWRLSHRVLRNPSRAGGEPARLDGQAHRVGHPQRVDAPAIPGVEQDAVAAQFHRPGSRRWPLPTPASMMTGYDGSSPLRFFEDDPDVVRVQDPLPAADRAAGGHDASPRPTALSRRAITGSSLV